MRPRAGSSSGAAGSEWRLSPAGVPGKPAASRGRRGLWAMVLLALPVVGCVWQVRAAAQAGAGACMVASSTQPVHMRRRDSTNMALCASQVNRAMRMRLDPTMLTWAEAGAHPHDLQLSRQLRRHAPGWVHAVQRERSADVVLLHARCGTQMPAALARCSRRRVVVLQHELLGCTPAQQQALLRLWASALLVVATHGLEAWAAHHAPAAALEHLPLWSLQRGAQAPEHNTTAGRCERAFGQHHS
jgi:hypothetical protein